MNRAILALLHCLWMICLSFSFYAHAQEEKSVTWAILGDRTSLENGFADLLSVKLDQSNYQLVERIQHKDIELELERSLESGSLSDSMRIGRRMGAQRLIVCQHQLDATQSEIKPIRLRVFLCDCEIAARIAVADFDLSDPAALVGKVGGWLDSVKNSLKTRQVVGLAPFACKNLDDTFLDIGKQSHKFLSDQILAIPGVALIEWDETKAINREIAGAIAAEQRIVPWLFAVDFRVIPNSKNTQPLVEVSLSAQSVGKPTTESANLGLLDLESWLRSKILHRLLDDQSAIKSGLSNEDQLRFLKERAQALFRLGAAATCAQVREVILQIDPNDSQERLSVMSDYGICAKVFDKNRYMSLYPLTSLEIQARSFQREHFEYLVRNNQISYADAIERFPLLVIDPESKLALTRISPKYALSQADLQRTLGSLEQDLHFVRMVGPAILKMAGQTTESNETELKRRVAWSQAVLSVARLHAWFHFGSEESRLVTIRLITDTIPQDFPTINTGEWLFATTTFPKAQVQVTDPLTRSSKRFDVGNWPEEVLELSKQYEHSGHRHVRLYIQWMQFCHRYAILMQENANPNPSSRGSGLPVAQLEAELQKIRREAMLTLGAERKGLAPPPQVHFDHVYDRSVRLSRELMSYVKANPPPIEPESQRPKQEFGRLRFQELNLSLPLLKYEAFLWQPDGPDHDLVYDVSSVYRLNRHGEFAKINPDKGFTFIDDELVWMLERKESGEVSVSAKNRIGQELIRDKSLTLPPYVDYLAIGAGAGKGILIGWFEGGTWFGLIEQSNDGVSLQVIHEAREYQASPVANDVKVASQSAGMRFEPRWYARGFDVHGECLLVGRYGMTPIRIDLKTWNVKVIPLEGADFLLGAKIVHQKFFQSEYAFVFEFDLNSTQKTIARKMVIGMDHLDQVKKGNATAGSNSGTLLVDGNWLVFPGTTWYRYNIVEGITERLVATSLPPPFAQGRTAQSSIHGLVHWQTKSDGNLSSLYQVTIEADSTSSRE